MARSACLRWLLLPLNFDRSGKQAAPSMTITNAQVVKIPDREITAGAGLTRIERALRCNVLNGAERLNALNVLNVISPLPIVPSR